MKPKDRGPREIADTGLIVRHADGMPKPGDCVIVEPADMADEGLAVQVYHLNGKVAGVSVWDKDEAAYVAHYGLVPPEDD